MQNDKVDDHLEANSLPDRQNHDRRQRQPCIVKPVVRPQVSEAYCLDEIVNHSLAWIVEKGPEHRDDH